MKIVFIVRLWTCGYPWFVPENHALLENDENDYILFIKCRSDPSSLQVHADVNQNTSSLAQHGSTEKCYCQRQRIILTPITSLYINTYASVEEIFCAFFISISVVPWGLSMLIILELWNLVHCTSLIPCQKSPRSKSEFIHKWSKNYIAHTFTQLTLK